MYVNYVWQNAGGTAVSPLVHQHQQQLSMSPQTQFDLALTLLRHQLQQPAAMTSSRRRGGDVTTRRHDDVTATESMLLSALGLALPSAAGTEAGDHYGVGTTDALQCSSPIGKCVCFICRHIIS